MGYCDFFKLLHQLIYNCLFGTLISVGLILKECRQGAIRFGEVMFCFWNARA